MQRFVIWLLPEPESPIEKIQELLYQQVPECDDRRRFSGGFKPHLTVGTVRGEEALEEVMAELQSNWQPIKMLFDRVSYIWCNAPPDDVFRVGEYFILGEN